MRKLFCKYLVEEDEFVRDIERRLNDNEIKLVDFEYKDNIVKVEFELTSDEEEHLEYIRSRVESVVVRIINKYFNIYGQAVDDTYYFEKNDKNIIKIELF